MRNCVASKFKVNIENQILDYLKRPHECHTASLFYKLINHWVSGESSNVKLLWQRDLRTGFTQEKWLEILSECGKRERGKRKVYTVQDNTSILPHADKTSQDETDE